MPETTLLHAHHISKSYTGVHALKAASFELRAGEVHALIGENGAGKSTLIKIITGAVAADSGTIVFNGEPLTHNSPQLAKARGIAAIYQQPALFPDLTVAENIALGLEKQSLWRRIEWGGRRTRAAELLAQVGAKIAPETLAGNLSMPEQQLVEIARALGADAKLLILDEPTASLSEEDTQNLFRVIRELRARGVGMIYISHRLEELPLIADRVTVLRDGETIATRAMAAVDRQELIRLMVGRELAAVFPKREVARGAVVLELRNVGHREAKVRDVNLQIRAGEIVGLAGLVGAGRTELARTIFGLTPADEGEIVLHGERVIINNPTDAIQHGIAYVPEDRRRHGVVLDLPISQNVSLASLDRLAQRGALDFARERDLARAYIERFAVKTPAIFAAAGTLSGGNQQKVALSRWLATEPRVLILDEPTQGIDVGAKSEIHALMCDLAAQGIAILMISSELPEVLGMSDRIAVMHAGTIAGVLERAAATPHNVLALALGHNKEELADL
jgi:rhamnose transport system ATP-binding protein